MPGETALSGQSRQRSSFPRGPAACIWLGFRPQETRPLPSIFHSSCVRPRAPKPVFSLVLSDTTQNAYNDWGGRNAYGYVSNDDFAGAYPSTSALRVPFGFQLSFERPLHGGFGNAFQSWEIPFIQWLARRGVAVDVCTCRDLHFAQPDRQKYRLLLFVGHQEYWTAQMRDSVEAFAKAGGNVAFFSGNVAWWQIRITPDGRQLICYKVAGFDPVSTTSNHDQTTVHWFDDLVKRPETALTGVSWLGDDAFYSDQSHRFTVKNADSWVFAGTGLANSDTFGGYSSMNDGNIDSSVCGGETDRVQSNGPNGMNSPAGYTLASIYDLVYPDLEVGTMGMFSPGGIVFNAATINWSLGLSRDAASWNGIDQITLNVLAKLRTAPSGAVDKCLAGQYLARSTGQRRFHFSGSRLAVSERSSRRRLHDIRQSNPGLGVME